MTARCALCVGALKIFGSPWLRPWLLFSKFLMVFVPIEPINVYAKVEVRTFTRSWDNRGRPTRKKWAVPGYAHAPFCLSNAYQHWTEYKITWAWCPIWVSGLRSLVSGLRCPAITTLSVCALTVAIFSRFRRNLAPNLTQRPKIRSMNNFYGHNSRTTKSKMAAAAILEFTFLGIIRPLLHKVALNLTQKLKMWSPRPRARVAIKIHMWQKSKMAAIIILKSAKWR